MEALLAVCHLSTCLLQLLRLFIGLIDMARVAHGKVMEHEYEPSEMGTRLALGGIIHFLVVGRASETPKGR
jgi:hypothetical protein